MELFFIDRKTWKNIPHGWGIGGPKKRDDVAGLESGELNVDSIIVCFFGSSISIRLE
jgi:hypothetical protein